MKHEEFSSLSATQVGVIPSIDDKNLYSKYLKRAFDLLFAIALLPVLLPIIAVLYVLTRINGGSGFFAHERVGQNGQTFKCLKIRTMVPDAQERLKGFLAENPEAKDEWKRTQKLVDDPRVTAVGRFLRRTSLDELPQLWNVLRGEMSFVGPRPVTAPELERYGIHKRAYLSLKPGITGVWQVEGRTNGCYDERLKMDQSYVKNMGFLYDLRLIVRTALVVVSPTGR